MHVHCGLLPKPPLPSVAHAPVCANMVSLYACCGPCFNFPVMQQLLQDSKMHKSGSESLNLNLNPNFNLRQCLSAGGAHGGRGGRRRRAQAARPGIMNLNLTLDLKRGCLQVVPTVGVEGDDGERKLRAQLRHFRHLLDAQGAGKAAFQRLWGRAGARAGKAGPDPDPDPGSELESDSAPAELGDSRRGAAGGDGDGVREEAPGRGGQAEGLGLGQSEGEEGGGADALPAGSAAAGLRRTRAAARGQVLQKVCRTAAAMAMARAATAGTRRRRPPRARTTKPWPSAATMATPCRRPAAGYQALGMPCSRGARWRWSWRRRGAGGSAAAAGETVRRMWARAAQRSRSSGCALWKLRPLCAPRQLSHRRKGHFVGFFKHLLCSTSFCII